MCVSFRCRYIRLEKLDKSSQDTLALLVARSGTKRNQPPPSEKQAFRLRQLISLSAGGSKVSCSRFYPISPGSHIYPGTRRDIAALVAVGRSVVDISTFFPSKEFIFSQVLVVERQAARFYKFASKALWSRRHLVSWDSWHKVPTNPSEPSVRCESPSSESVPCGELINLAAVRISTSP